MDTQIKGERTTMLTKGLWVLFWLNLIGIVGISSIFDEGTVLYTVFLFAELALELGKALILIRLGALERSYKIAGGCFGAVVIYDGLLLVLTLVLGASGTAPVWIAALSLLTPLVDLVAGVFEMTGHIAVVEDVEDGIAEGWKKLRMWYVIILTVMQLTNYFGGIQPELAATVAGTAAVLLLIVMVFRMVSLYRTVQALRKYGA